jgi:glyoxylase I family protein
MTGNNPILGGGGLHHVAIRTSDFDASCAFYTGVLGFVKTTQFERRGSRFAWLDTGQGDYLEIFELLEGQTEIETDKSAHWHLCLRTTKIEEVVAAVEAAGCEITVPTKTADLENTVNDPPTPFQIKVAFFRGPSGELVELLQEAADSSTS